MQPVDFRNRAGDRELVEAAIEARKHAYAPYSNFPVGAAIRSANGRIYAGCNVENASFGLTMCAERIALFAALAGGERSFTNLALVGDAQEISPCGACRQVLAEFSPDLEIIMSNVAGSAVRAALSELLPAPFVLKPNGLGS
ncbi:MAG: cytidine deaminase [Zoogloeaceae bacterium]|nr:cytidine deaminase [Zoogloeaceae bacterium]